MNYLRFITFLSYLFVGSLGIAQQGDKANEKDIISSLNWKKWSPDVVPVFTAEESLAQFKVAPGFKVELVAAEPMVKDHVLHSLKVEYWWLSPEPYGCVRTRMEIFDVMKGKSSSILPPLPTAILSMQKTLFIMPSITGCTIRSLPASWLGGKEN